MCVWLSYGGAIQDFFWGGGFRKVAKVDFLMLGGHEGWLRW